MKKSKVTVTRTAAELAKALGLTPADGAEIALRSDLNSKIVEVVQRKGLTHAQVARLARTSRTRVTAIMNRNTKDVSTDLLLRVLYSMPQVQRDESPDWRRLETKPPHPQAPFRRRTRAPPQRHRSLFKRSTRSSLPLSVLKLISKRDTSR